MCTQMTHEQGLRRLDDDTLAQIIEGDISEDGKLSEAGRIAMEELSNRTPK
jgi:phosphoribosylformimino-5-aminoimidazole carboxamide ribonucleotide (ProFAR) isomerase